ncbi:MAG: phosphatidylserine decarboxylase [Lachnospiraceae bacterium]|nr:phosphatidylserine decarboxylase [Lachnospiraceae bacterium]
MLLLTFGSFCSCNWEDSVKVGAKVEKSNPMGYFLFGGSDIVMVFQKGVRTELVCPLKSSGDGYDHLLMNPGSSYIKCI